MNNSTISLVIIGKWEEKICSTHHRSGLPYTMNCAVMLRNSWGQFLTHKEWKICLICKLPTIICSSTSNDRLPGNCSDYSESAECFVCRHFLCFRNHTHKKKPTRHIKFQFGFSFSSALPQALSLSYMSPVSDIRLYLGHMFSHLLYFPVSFMSQRAWNSHWTASNLNDYTRVWETYTRQSRK